MGKVCTQKHAKKENVDLFTNYAKWLSVRIGHKKQNRIRVSESYYISHSYSDYSMITYAPRSLYFLPFCTTYVLGSSPAVFFK